MARYAHIRDGAVWRRLELTEAPPAHKPFLVPIVEIKPPFDSFRQYLSGPVETIESNEVVQTWTVENIPLDTLKGYVKQEAQRRIIAITGASDIMSCLTKQLNAQMRAAELINIKAEGGQLTAEQEAEAAALQALADSIKAIRAKSNEIEALDPIPADYAADARWT